MSGKAGGGAANMSRLESMAMVLRFSVVASLALAVAGSADIYIVTMEGDPVVSYNGGVEGFASTAAELGEKIDVTSGAVSSYSAHLEKQHDALLEALFEAGTYNKIYSYRHLINGFAVHTTPEQAEALSKVSRVKHVVKDMKVKRLTTHTPQFLGLPTGVWPTGGGFDRAGEDIVIGFIDSGIYPEHPSFATHIAEPYRPVPHYKGKCEIDPDTKKNFCNGKIVGAQHFAAAAKASGQFNPSVDFASPLDGDGHGRYGFKALELQLLVEAVLYNWGVNSLYTFIVTSDKRPDVLFVPQFRRIALLILS